MPRGEVESLAAAFGFGDFFFQHVSDLLCVLDHDFVIRKLNPAWGNSGIDPETICGTDFISHTQDHGRQELAHKLEQVQESPNTVHEVKCRFVIPGKLPQRLKFHAQSTKGKRIMMVAKDRFSKESGETGLMDPLTNLPNRTLFIERAKLSIAEANREGIRVAFHFIDLDKFKPVNDRHGHEVGDHVLKILAKRMLGSIREMDTVARVGGDEFVVVQTGLRQGIHATLMAKRILSSLTKPIAVDDDLSVRVGASIGIAVYPDNGEDLFELISLADETMYEVKKSGREGYGFYNVECLSR